MKDTRAKWSHSTAFPTTRISARRVWSTSIKIANFEKKVPLEWVNTYRTDMGPAFLQYARPLIQAELTPVYIDGLPRHIFMK